MLTAAPTYPLGQRPLPQAECLEIAGGTDRHDISVGSTRLREKWCSRECHGTVGLHVGVRRRLHGTPPATNLTRLLWTVCSMLLALSDP